MNAREQRLLMNMVNLVTAPGREHRVIREVNNWAKSRVDVDLTTDRTGNLIIKRKGISTTRPLVLVAHMDHPGFLVTRRKGKRIHAIFRGVINHKYIRYARIRLYRNNDDTPTTEGTIVHVTPSNEPYGGHRVEVACDCSTPVRPGDVMTWALKPARIRRGQLYAPVTDNLTGVAAAMICFDRLVDCPHDIRLLFTRAEEVGCLGAIEADRSGLLPPSAQIVVLENTRCYPDTPVGGGPIVRVGDRTCTYDPDLTFRIKSIANNYATRHRDFRWQYRLMLGGSCEASVYQILGYSTSCVCLALANYHNMNERTGKIDTERISLNDFQCMVKLLVEIGSQLPRTKHLDRSALELQNSRTRLKELLIL
ncbi:MAG: hypothetical protein IT445_17305 [Phycisphaeraceae bacterium]|nr:hypothetical protein [Phycisphaeraceae bacterium]